MKKWNIVILLTIMIPIVFFVSCDEKNETPNTAAMTESLMNMDSKYPVTKNRYDLEMLIPSNVNVIDYATVEQTLFMEKLTNIHINFTVVPLNDINQKLNVLLNSGGKLPDVFWGCNGFFLLERMQGFGENGLVQPLNDLLDKYAPNFTKIDKDNPNSRFRERLTVLDGNIYGLTNMQANLQIINALPYRMWINQGFLDKLGMVMPTDITGFYNYLKAVKEKDPNGNGRNDEIPLTGYLPTTASPQGAIDVFIMNMFILDDLSNHRLILNNDIISPAYTTPEWQEGLIFMNKLYREGLLDPNAFTQNLQQLKQVVEMEDAMKVGAAASFTDYAIANIGGSRIDYLKALPPLKGPKGVQTTPFLKYNDLYAGLTFVISRDCKNPAIALRWADAFMDEDPSINSFIRYGVLGRDWEIPQQDSGPSITGGIPRFKLINDLWGKPQNVYWGGNGLRYVAFNSYDRTPIEGYDSEVILYNASMAYKPYAHDPVPPLLYTTEENVRIQELQVAIDNYISESIARFTIGDLNIDKDWNSYLTELETIGIKEYIKILQGAYDRQWKK
ncbi:MAG: extracellular solute-binding protein [Bacteroidales bacterium]|jgi:putative aldouronate transport system substrate-binding protein|nr:extracellular solute-binding protein [Bacteroidales bacterium]